MVALLVVGERLLRQPQHQHPRAGLEIVLVGHAQMEVDVSVTGNVLAIPVVKDQ